MRIAQDQNLFHELLRRDLPFYSFIVLYILLTFAVAHAFDASNVFSPLSVLDAYIDVAVLVFAVLVVWLALQSLRHDQPLVALRQSIAATVIPFRVNGALMVFALAVFMSTFGSAKALLPYINPFWSDTLLADVDAALAFGQPPAAYLPRSPFLTLIIDQLYGWPWFFVMFCSISAAALSKSDYRSQYLWTFLLAWTLLGNVLACLFMSGGPIYFELLTGRDDFRYLVEDVARKASWSNMVRAQLWEGYTNKQSGVAQGISAFPSMHVSMSTMFVLQTARTHSLWLWPAVLLLIWILFSAVYLGWHYAIDGYCSIILTILLWKIVGHGVNFKVTS